MSDPRRIITKLSVGAVHLNDAPTETNLDGITWEIVAASLAALPPLTRLILRVKWGGQQRLHGDLVQWTLYEATRIFKVRGWRYQESDLLNKLTSMVVADLIHNPVCPRCQGRTVGEQSVIIDKKGLALCCPLCNGTGSKDPLSGRQRAKWLGISEKNWRSRWRERYLVLLKRLRYLEDEGLQHVHRVTKDTPDQENLVA